MRIKRGVSVRRRHKKLKKLTKGYLKSRRASVKRAREAVYKAGQHSFIDRRRKKRDFRRLWNTQINNACRERNIKYSELIQKLKVQKIDLDRKILAQIAIGEPEIFSQIVKEIKK